MREEKILCDNCNNDLTYGINFDDDLLKLSSKSKGVKEYCAVIDVAMLPLIEKDMHFCGLGCLKKWVEQEVK